MGFFDDLGQALSGGDTGPLSQTLGVTKKQMEASDAYTRMTLNNTNQQVNTGLKDYQQSQVDLLKTVVSVGANGIKDATSGLSTPIMVIGCVGIVAYIMMNNK